MSAPQSSIGTLQLDIADRNALMILLQDDISYAGIDRQLPDPRECTCQTTRESSRRPLQSCAFTDALDALSQMKSNPSISVQPAKTDLVTRLQRLGETCLFLKAAHLGWEAETLQPTLFKLETLKTEACNAVRSRGVDPGFVAVAVGGTVGSTAAFLGRRLSR